MMYVVDVRAIGIAITHVAPRPTGTNLSARAVVSGRVIRHEPVIVVFNIHDPSQLKLFEIVQAHDRLGFGSGTGECREKQARQDPDDGDDDEEFDQRKTTR